MPPSTSEQAIELGDAPSKYTATVGCRTFMPRIVLATLHLNRGRWEPALELLRWCVETPRRVHGQRSIRTRRRCFQSGEEPETVVAQVEKAGQKLTAAGRFMLGTALFEQGHAPVAEPQFRKVIEKQPHGWAAARP